MKIGFVLPGTCRFPGGGFKVVYEYANFLASHGHKVSIYFDCSSSLKRFHLPESVRKIAARYLVWKRPSWFPLDPQVRKIGVFGVTNQVISQGDAIFATAVSTAVPVSRLSADKGQKFYLIQGYENWEVSDAEVQATYQLGMTNIVVSKWLENIVQKFAPHPVLISNSINSDVFNIQKPLNQRNRYSLIFHWRKESYKGGGFALELIEKLHRKYPDFKFTAISNLAKPENFPNYVEYVYGIPPEEVARLNNQHALFVCTSVAEGFGLPGLEGMACGCALVSSGYQGVYDYAVNEENALISPVKDVDAMFRNVERLLRDDSLRIRLAQAGYECAMKRTLAATGMRLEQLLLSDSDRT